MLLRQLSYGYHEAIQGGSFSNFHSKCNSQGRNADSLSQYFGEDPARCPFEQGL